MRGPLGRPKDLSLNQPEWDAICFQTRDAMADLLIGADVYVVTNGPPWGV